MKTGRTFLSLSFLFAALIFSMTASGEENPFDKSTTAESVAINSTADTSPPSLVQGEAMPYPGEGINDPMNVSNKTAIRVRLFDETGVATEGINHTGISAYAVHQNGAETLEPLTGQTSFREVEAGNPTDVWAMFLPDYAHTYSSGLPEDLIVQVVVQACDLLGNATTYFVDGAYRFKVGTEMRDAAATMHDPNSTATGDTCTVTLDEGEMHGARMEFSDALVPQPYFGPSEEVPPLPDTVHPYGIPLNLQPPMIFTEGCLSLFIPVPEPNKPEQFSVWRYEPETGWKRAEAGDGWLESRIDHVSDRVGEPSTIELCINHFTGVQLTTDDHDHEEDDEDEGNHFFISGSCFIATAAYGSPTAKEVVTLRTFRDAYLMKTGSGRAFIRFYYRVSPTFAKVIARHQILRAATVLALTPIVWTCKLLLISPYAGLAIIAAWLLAFSLVFGWLVRREKKKATVAA